MRYEQLNKNWNAEPNAPEPQMEKGEGYVEFKFELNPFLFDYIDKGDKGVLEFAEVYKLDFGAMNDEGYFRGQHRFNNNILPWGEFYELFDSNWKIDFPKSSQIINSVIDKSKLRHFIFFLKDNTIECLSLDYSLSIQFADQSAFDKKYPNEYFNHYIAMFSVNHSEIKESSLIEFNNQYIQFEGRDEYQRLKNEVLKIKANNDFDWFLKQAKSNQIENATLDSIKKSIELILQ